MITDLQPRSFWNKLGFSDTNINTKLKFDDAVFRTTFSGNPAVSAAYFDARRIEATLVSGDYRSPFAPGVMSRPFGPGALNTDGHLIGKVTLTYTVASTTTNSLDADNNYEVDDSGYYRIEVESVFSIEFKQEGQRLGTVIGCVSNNYQQNDYITGYGADSGIPYVHEGVSQVLSSVKCKIIDPATNLPVDTLGPNSTILLEIVKASKAPNQK